MATITTDTKILVATAQKQKTAARTSVRFWEELEFNRFGFVALLLVVMVCTGGLAAAVAIGGSEWKLMAVAFCTVAVQFLVMIIAPMRAIVVATAIALLVDLFVFLT